MNSVEDLDVFKLAHELALKFIRLKKVAPLSAEPGTAPIRDRGTEISAAGGHHRGPESPTTPR